LTEEILTSQEGLCSTDMFMKNSYTLNSLELKYSPVTVLLKLLLCPMNSHSLPFLTIPLSSLPVTTVPRPRKTISVTV
jgi:hypothetical protein